MECLSLADMESCLAGQNTVEGYGDCVAGESKNSFTVSVLLYAESRIIDIVGLCRPL